MEKKLHFTLVTPEKEAVADYVDQVNVPGTEGDMGILYDHSPIISTLRPGQLSYEKGDETISLVVSHGYMEVTDNRVTVLAETAEFLSDIDAKRAQAAKSKAELLLAKGGLSQKEEEEAHKKLFRAIARLENSEQK
ncbi:MAG: F0F1 ATP synthase subunit epsilon [Nitrospinae bacterium]|nr:F0F1 ATP synthase subunit epsilon [Nitrospinota bacterium]